MFQSKVKNNCCPSFLSNINTGREFCVINRNIKILIHQTTTQENRMYVPAWNKKAMFIKLVDRWSYFNKPWTNVCISWMLIESPFAVITVHSTAHDGLQSTSQCATRAVERASSLRSPHTGYRSLCLPSHRLCLHQWGQRSSRASGSRGEWMGFCRTIRACVQYLVLNSHTTL